MSIIPVAVFLAVNHAHITVLYLLAAQPAATAHQPILTKLAVATHLAVCAIPVHILTVQHVHPAKTATVNHAAAVRVGITATPVAHIARQVMKEKMFIQMYMNAYQ